MADFHYGDADLEFETIGRLRPITKRLDSKIAEYLTAGHITQTDYQKLQVVSRQSMAAGQAALERGDYPTNIRAELVNQLVEQYTEG